MSHQNHYNKLILSVKKQYCSNLVLSSSENPWCLWQTVNRLLHCKYSSPFPFSTSFILFDGQNFQTSLSNQHLSFCISTRTPSSLSTSTFFYVQVGISIWMLNCPNKQFDSDSLPIWLLKNVLLFSSLQLPMLSNIVSARVGLLSISLLKNLQYLPPEEIDRWPRPALKLSVSCI